MNAKLQKQLGAFLAQCGVTKFEAETDGDTLVVRTPPFFLSPGDEKFIRSCFECCFDVVFLDLKPSTQAPLPGFEEKNSTAPAHAGSYAAISGKHALVEEIENLERAAHLLLREAAKLRGTAFNNGVRE